jgi:hypothetical protein
VKAYYDRRAPEYDDWWLGRGLYADRDRPGWDDELRPLEGVIRDLPAVRTLDACGTGFLTRHLVETRRARRERADARGRTRTGSAGTLERGDALSLPFDDTRSTASSRVTHHPR